MKLDVESLRALLFVVETGGFTEAAAKLGVTQSATSWKIKRLEERVGVELVKRGSTVEATPDGRDLISFAERIVSAHDDAVEHLSRSELSGAVRLGTNEDLRGGQLADVLARFARMYPHIKLEAKVQLTGVVKEWLEDGAVDIALLQLAQDEVAPDDVILWTEPLMWVHSNDSRFDPANELPIVSFGPGLEYLDAMYATLERSGLDARTVLECPMLQGVQDAVTAGLGLSALNRRNMTSEMVVWEHNEIAPLPVLCEIVRAGDSANTDVIQALKDALQTALVDTGQR